jgi:rare lipoprotein A
MGRRQVAPGGPGANQSVGGQGAITGSVHGHPVEAYGPPELAGQTLHDPITATSLGGGLGGTSAKFGANMHEGIDLMAPVGAPVYASKSGTIVRAPKPGGGTDQVLTIKHDDGVYSRYLHQGPASVKEGDVVAGGQQIGTSGYRNAAHTHFEMWHGTPGGRDSKLMNARAIYGWNKGNLPQGGRAMTAMGPGGQGQPAVAGGRPAPATASLTPPTADTPSARGSPDGGQGQPPVAGGEGQSSVTKGSFYDTGAQTSTGERFDPEGYTAAIRQSDRNQWGGVRAGGGDQWADVTDQNTGKTVRVRVNDVMGKRDPQDRGIDLSRGSMRALDPSLKSGVLPNLKVTRLPPGKYSGGPVNAEAVSKSAQAGPGGNKSMPGWDQGAADERINARERQLKEQGSFESGYPSDDLSPKDHHVELDALEKRHAQLRHSMSQPIKMHVDAPQLPPHYESAWRRSAGKQQQKYINDSISRNERTAFGASALDYGLG